MERALRMLMDYQRFDGNRELQQVINATHARYRRRALSAEEAGWVAAAGAPEAMQTLKERVTQL